MKTVKAELTGRQLEFAIDVLRRAAMVHAKWGAQPTAVEVPRKTLIDHDLGETDDHGIVVKIGTMRVIPVEGGDFDFAFLMPNTLQYKWPNEWPIE